MPQKMKRNIKMPIPYENKYYMMKLGVKVGNIFDHLDKGEINSQGTHEELVREDGLYAKLSTIQFKNYNLREVNI